MRERLFLGTQRVYANEIEPPKYKSKTADECILEKECAWYAFTVQIGLFHPINWKANGSTIHKWDKSLDLMVGGDTAHPYLPRLVEITNQLVPYFGQPIQIVNDKPYYLIVFSDDPEKTFLQYEDKLNLSTKKMSGNILK